jgi:hypothetical protein
MSSSRIIAGDGSAGSGAYIKMNGPMLNIYDNSIISAAGKNNYYFDWNPYHYYTSTAAAMFTSYATKHNNNCGGSDKIPGCAERIWFCYFEQLGFIGRNGAGLIDAFHWPIRESCRQYFLTTLMKLISLLSD